MLSNKRCPYEAYVTKYCYTCGSSHAGLQPIPKPRRRPTDTERLDFLMRHLKRGGPLEVDLHSRRGIDRLMREEARRG